MKVAKISTASMREPEAAGISRFSLGPGLIKASLSIMKTFAQEPWSIEKVC
jgi:hypothetical protein